jgi:hypothetical protein
MALTVAQAQKLIILKVGDVNPETGEPTTLSDGIVAANIGLLWAAYEGLSSRSRELCIRRDAIEMVIAVLAPRVDYTIKDESVKLHQLIDTYRGKYNAVTKEIEIAGKSSYRRGLPATGLITKVEPDEPVLYPKGPQRFLSEDAIDG